MNPANKPPTSPRPGRNAQQAPASSARPQSAPINALPTPELTALAQSNTAFALALYEQLKLTASNLCFAPSSVAVALLLAYAGAQGTTAQQMAQVLQLTLAPPALHNAAAALLALLEQIQGQGNVELRSANRVWPQRHYPLLPTYLTVLQTSYGVTVTPLDYATAPVAAQEEINAWVAAQTAGKINELIPKGLLDELTRLVLTNALYCKGQWLHQFDQSRTQTAPFRISPTTSVAVPFMEQTQTLYYADNGAVQILELPYRGNDLAMWLLLPKTDAGLPALEASLTPGQIAQWLDPAARSGYQREVTLVLPKFTIKTELQLDSALQSLGMTDAFSESKANFAGIDGKPDWLYISRVCHQAVVEVNEEGAEAAAATAVIVKTRSLPLPPRVVRFDRPFLFLICDSYQRNILFWGRIVDPTATK